MKKVASLALTLLLAFTLFGCSESKPDPVVAEFCAAVQAFDFEAAAACMENGSEDLGNPYEDTGMEEDFDTEQILTYLKDWAAKMTYEVGESTVDGESASVPVSFTYVDASPVVTSALGEYIAQAFALALGGADEAQMETLFTTIFAEKADSVETGTATVDVTFPCVMTDDGWKIASFSEDNEDILTNIFTSNILIAFEELDESFGE